MAAQNRNLMSNYRQLQNGLNALNRFRRRYRRIPVSHLQSRSLINRVKNVFRK